METSAAHSAITLAIGGGVGTICRFLVQGGLHGRWASIAAAVITAIFVGVHALDAGDFARGNFMTYLLAYTETLMIAAGSFKAVEETQKKFGNATSMWFAVLLTGALAVSGCAGAPPPSTPTPAPVIPDVVERFDGDARAAAKKALDLLELATTAEEKAADAYLTAAAGGAIPAAVDTAVQKAFIRLSDSIIAGVKNIRDGVREWSQLRAILQPIVTATNALVARVHQVGGPSTDWRQLVSDLAALVAKLAAPSPPGAALELSGGAG